MEVDECDFLHGTQMCDNATHPSLTHSAELGSSAKEKKKTTTSNIPFC